VAVDAVVTAVAVAVAVAVVAAVVVVLLPRESADISGRTGGENLRGV